MHSTGGDYKRAATTATRGNGEALDALWKKRCDNKKKYKKMCYDVVLFLRCLEFPHRVAFPLDDMFMALAMIQIAPIDHRC